VNKIKLAFVALCAIAIGLQINLIDQILYIPEIEGVSLSSAGNIVLSIIFSIWILSVGSELSLSISVKTNQSPTNQVNNPTIQETVQAKHESIQIDPENIQTNQENIPINHETDESKTTPENIPMNQESIQIDQENIQKIEESEKTPEDIQTNQESKTIPENRRKTMN
jgi:hypothetical protein